MSMFDRLKNVARGKASAAVGDLERNHAAAVYASAIDNAVARIAEHKQAAAGLAAQRNQLDEKVAGLESQLADVRKVLAEALHDDDADTAVVLVARKDELEAARDEAARERDQVAAAVDETIRGLRQLERDATALKRERESALAQLEAAEAAIEIADTASGLSTSAEARGLDSVRSRIESLHQRAHEGYLDEEGESIRGRAAALGRKAAENDARAELERLKRQLAGGAPDEAAPEPSEPPAPPVDAPRKRDL